MICFDNQGLDLIAIEKIDPKLMAKEPDLFDTKWWDYRTVHPVIATQLFAEAYIQAARDYWVTNWDCEVGHIMKPISGWDIYHRPPAPLSEKTGKPLPSKQKKGVSKANIQGFWKARQEADALGMPYDLYCRYAIDYAKKGLWTYIPRPIHLYQRKIPASQISFKEHSMMGYIEFMWGKYKATRTMIAEEDYYLAVNNKYELYQVAHRVAVMEEIKERDQPEWGLVYALHDKAVLIESECRRYFGDRVVDRSIAFSED